MGYYIQTKSAYNKVSEICRMVPLAFKAKYSVAKQAMEDPDLGVIVVMDNGLFQAAGFAYSKEEFEAFTMPTDPRPKEFVIMGRKEAERLSGYTGK